jgi:hypothetical protein
VPRTWDAAELASFELPLVNARASARHVAPDYYYRIPVRAIYKSYPIYEPGREPPGYLEWLGQQQPEVAFDASTLTSDADWIAAGESVFDAPIGYGATFKLSQVRDRAWYARNRIPVTKDGVMPFSRYLVRKKGVVEVGSGACLMCHARVMPDGTLLKGAQGNFPADRVIADNLRRQSADAKDRKTFLEGFGLTADVLLDALADRIRSRASTRCPSRTSRRSTMRFHRRDHAREPQPVCAGADSRPDRARGSRHLDHTGVVLQRSIADLMRYVALVQGPIHSIIRRFFLLDLPPAAACRTLGDEQLCARSLPTR